MSKKCVKLKSSRNNENPVVEAFVAISRSTEGIGGWGAVINVGDDQRERSGGQLDVTGPQLNLRAAGIVLDFIFRECGKCKVRLHIDSYVAEGVEMLPIWRANGWYANCFTRKIAHRSLWERLDERQSKHSSVRFVSMGLRTRKKLRKEAERSKQLAREARKLWVHMRQAFPTIGRTGHSIRL